MISFLTPENNLYQVILQRNSFREQPVSPAAKLPQENIVKKTALLIREFVTALTENSTDVFWPLIFEELYYESRDARHILQRFYGYLLGGDLHHKECEKIKDRQSHSVVM